MNKISIIIPVLNEERIIKNSLEILQYIQERGHELIVVDGGSIDKTGDIAKKYTSNVISCEKGRALQMNAGAKVAKGDILIFLHIDTILSPCDFRQLWYAINDDDKAYRWGFFPLRLSSPKMIYRIIEFFINKKSHFTGIATGDQILFMSKKLFQHVGGFDSLCLMEDLAMCKKMKKISRPTLIDATVTTSSRRWENNGVYITIIQMWMLRLAYYLGVNTRTLARKYYG